MRSTFACLLALALPLAALAQDYRYGSIDYPGAITTVIYAVNNRGQVVGMEKDAAGTRHAIVGTPQQLSLLDPAGPIGTAPQSWAFSINRRGEIAGAYQDPAGVRHGYVRRSGSAFEMVDFPGVASTEAFGINDTGTVIGIYYDAAGAPHAFTLKDGQYRHNDLEGAVTTIPLSINDHGDIVGYYVDAANHAHGFIATPTGDQPEQQQP